MINLTKRLMAFFIWIMSFIFLALFLLRGKSLAQEQQVLSLTDSVRLDRHSDDDDDDVIVAKDFADQLSALKPGQALVFAYAADHNGEARVVPSTLQGEFSVGATAAVSVAGSLFLVKSIEGLNAIALTRFPKNGSLFLPVIGIAGLGYMISTLLWSYFSLSAEGSLPAEGSS